MARDNTDAENQTKHQMIDVYRAQEDKPDGFNDWGIFTAYVVHAQREEIKRLNGLLRSKGIEPGEWQDPLERQCVS